jgi:hypothetical protein
MRFGSDLVPYCRKANIREPPRHSRTPSVDCQAATRLLELRRHAFMQWRNPLERECYPEALEKMTNA